MSHKYTSTARNWRGRYRPVVVRLEDRTVPSFIAAQCYSTGPDPDDILTADFNADGHADLASTSSNGRIYILLAKGSGKFASSVGYTAGSTGLALGDFDSDGHADLVAGRSGYASVLMGKGDGTFNPYQNYSAAKHPTALVVADINGDGKQDVAVLERGDSKGGSAVLILLGNGDGSFGYPTAHRVGKFPSALTTGDFNDDGHTDLVVADRNQSDYTLSVLLGNGDATFKPLRHYVVGLQPYAVKSADFDRDGNLDLASTNYDSDTVSVLLGRGDGSFKPRIDYPAGDGPRGLAIGDVDSDGGLDLAVTNVDAKVSLILGKGDGTFEPPARYVVAGTAKSVTLGNLSDDRLDVAVTSSIYGHVSVLLSGEDGTFPTSVQYLAGKQPGAVATGDFNKDGFADFAAAGGAVRVFLGNGNGTFRSPMTIPMNNHSTISASDFDLDGRLDLVVRTSKTSVGVLLGNGDGTFGGIIHSEAAMQVSRLAVGDFDGNGLPDLAVADISYAGKVSVLLGKGNGTFETPLIYPTGIWSGWVATADFDGDRDFDLVVSNNGGTLSVLLNVGNGTFGPAVSYTVGRDLGSIAAEDLSGDGYPDLAVASNTKTRALCILIGSGDGTFGPPTRYIVGTGTRSVLMEDFDRDGRTDVAVTNESGTLSLLRGRGDGALHPQEAYAAGASPFGSAIADFDGNGYPDVVVTNYTGFKDGMDTGHVTVLINAGDWVPVAPTSDPSAGETTDLNHSSLSARDDSRNGMPTKFKTVASEEPAECEGVLTSARDHTFVHRDHAATWEQALELKMARGQQRRLKDRDIAGIDGTGLSDVVDSPDLL